MPTREGKRVRKQRNRNPTDRGSPSRDNEKRKINNNRWPDEDSDDVDDYDGNASDSDFLSPDISMIDEEVNETQNIYTPRIAPQRQHQNSEASSATTVQSFCRPSNQYLDESTKERYLDDRQLPAEIFTIFSNVTSTTKVNIILKDIQDKEEIYRTPKDEHGKRTTPTKIHSFPRKQFVDHFKEVNFGDFEQYKPQILEYIQNPILQKSSCGILLYNSKREVLAVQNPRGHWSAPKGHRKIKDSNQFETIKETASRKFNQEIRVTNRINNEICDYYDFDQEHHLDSSKYVEYDFFDQKSDKNVRCIGLFIVEIDESKLAFDLPDKYENHNCGWLKLDDVLVHRPKPSFDYYYTLRPFAEWFKNSLLFHDNIPNNQQYQQK